jgi:hypothetical protein
MAKMHSRKAHRKSAKSHRKVHRKSRKAHRRSSRKMRGGELAPAPLMYRDASMMNQSLAQGRDFERMTVGMHGGMAPVEQAYAGPFLNGQAALQAGVAPLDSAIGQIAGMSDQAGGRRKRRSASRKGRKSSKGRKASRKGRKSSKTSRKGRKSSKSGRKNRQHGGASASLNEGSPLSAPAMLLKDYAGAGLSPAWVDVKNAESMMKPLAL